LPRGRRTGTAHTGPAGDRLRHLTHGELAQRAESHLIEDSPADPPEIADTIATVIQTPRGQRPVRVLGPGVRDFIGDLHDAATRVQAGIMAASGFGDLTTARPA
jgi:hypothetical protein